MVSILHPDPLHFCDAIGSGLFSGEVFTKKGSALPPCLLPPGCLAAGDLFLRRVVCFKDI